MATKHAFLEPVTRSFVETVNANAANGPPLYTLSAEDARKVLEDLQSSDNALSDDEVDSQEITTDSGIPIVLFTPKQTSYEKLPVVVYTHGGGWILGSPKTHARLIRDLVKATGFAFAFIYYTNAPEGTWDIVTKQVYEGLSFIVKTANNYNLDGTKVAVAGDSAGGNLAIANTINNIRHHHTPKLSATVLLYPVTDISQGWDKTESMKANGKGLWLEVPVLDWMYKAYAPDGSDRDNILVSPLHASKQDIKDFPPTLLIAVENDPLRDEGEQFARNLADAGVDVTSLRVGQTVHDYLMLNPLSDSPATKGSVDTVAGFLKRHLQ